MDSLLNHEKPHETNNYEAVDKDPGERLLWFGEYCNRLKFNELPEMYIQIILNQYIPEYDQGESIPHKRRYVSGPQRTHIRSARLTARH